MANDKILEVKDLSVSFNTYAGEVKAVRGVSFELNRGETLAFVGESGCGKTVTAKSILRLLKPPFAVIKEGSQITCDGKDVLALNKKELCEFRGDEVSMIFQDPMTSLNPTMTVGKQIMESLRIHRHLSKKEAREEAIRMLKMVNIPSAEKRVDSYPHEMSGGMRQRVMIAMALACNPKILIADEPTTALDVTIQAQIMDLMREPRPGCCSKLCRQNSGYVRRSGRRARYCKGNLLRFQASIHLGTAQLGSKAGKRIQAGTVCAQRHSAGFDPAAQLLPVCIQM